MLPKPRTHGAARVGEAALPRPGAAVRCSTCRWPQRAASLQVCAFQGQPCASAHCSTCRWPQQAASLQACSSQGQPCCRAHCSTSRWPPHAAAMQVPAFQGQPWPRAHCSTSRKPPAAAGSHVLSSQWQPCCRAHCSISRWPWRAASTARLRIPGATLLVGPLQRAQTAAGCCLAASRRIPGAALCARAHCSTSRWPPAAASLQVH
jgi:hypothetical protein